jgi:hypothetical protein
MRPMHSLPPVLRARRLWFGLQCFWLSRGAALGGRSHRYSQWRRGWRVGYEYAARDSGCVVTAPGAHDGAVRALRGRLVSRLSDELAGRFIQSRSPVQEFSV